MSPSRSARFVAALAVLAGVSASGCTTADGPSAAEERSAPALAVIGNGSAGSPDQVLWLSVAGLRPEHYLGPGATMPTLAALARGGVAAERVTSVTPATVYPVHAMWMTGLTADVHGVPADHRLGEHGVATASFREADALRAAPLWQRVRDAGGVVAALDWPGTFGADISVLIPDVAAAPGAPWHLRAADASTPVLAGLVRGALQADRRGPGRDAFVAATACRLLRARVAPRLTLVRLSQAQPVLLQQGPRSAAAAVAFAALDRAIADLVACLGSERLARTAVVVTGDAAYEPVHTALRPNAVLAAAGLGGRGAWRAVARSHGGSAFVYAHREADALRARRALEEAAAASTAFRVVGAEEMIAAHADPESWFGLAAAPGFVFEDGWQGPVEAPAGQLGAAGYLGPEGAAGMGAVLWGRGVRSGVRVPLLSGVDLGPTVASLLGVALEPAAGRPRLGWLRPGSASHPPSHPGKVDRTPTADGP